MAIQEIGKVPVDIILEEPFQISPRFGQVQKEDSEGDLVFDTIPLKIQGGGIGEIRIVHLPGDFGEDSNLPIRVPAGEIRAAFIYTDSGVKADVKEVPIELDVAFGRLPLQVLETLRFAVVYENRNFEASLFIDGIPDPDDTDQTIGAVQGHSYIDLKDQTHCWLVLPQDEKVFQKLFFTLSSDPNTHLEEY